MRYKENFSEKLVTIEKKLPYHPIPKIMTMTLLSVSSLAKQAKFTTKKYDLSTEADKLITKITTLSTLKKILCVIMGSQQKFYGHFCRKKCAL